MFIYTDYGFIGRSKYILEKNKPQLRLSGIKKDKVNYNISYSFKIKSLLHSVYYENLNSEVIMSNYGEELFFDELSLYRIGIIK